MTPRAKLTVTTGPDRGKEFDVADELIHIGRGAENQIVLSDPTLEEHQASLVCRNGRFAIYTLVDEIEIDGNKVPPEQWVWLPAEAQINFNRRTAMRFVSEGGSEPAAASQPAAAARTAETVPPRREPEGRVAGTSASGTGTATLPRPRPASDAGESASEIPKPKRSAKADKKTARFITDGPGDPLVKLGEDGHLPELQLDEGKVREAREQKNKQANPWLMVVAIVFSFGFSALMLLVDFEQLGSGVQTVGDARDKIREYYGVEGDVLKPYQMHLRLARQAHSRGDFRTERQEYRAVLDLLFAEGKSKFTGVTGTPESDERLEKLISVILSQ